MVGFVSGSNRVTLKDQLAGVAFVGKPKRVANNTVRYTKADGSEVIRLHMTDVVTKKPNGNLVLDSGGWKTPTTKARINEYGKVQVWTDRGTWYIGGSWNNKTGRLAFYDGIEVTPDGKPVSANVEATASMVAKADTALKARIKAFVGKLDKMETLPEPNNGDCWFCLFHDQDGKSWGDASSNTEHFRHHIRDGYLHGSLILNAMKAQGYRDTGIGYYWHLFNRGDKWARAAIKRALRQYLGHAFGLATR